MEPLKNTRGEQTRTLSRTLQTRRPKPPPGGSYGSGARRARAGAELRLLRTPRGRAAPELSRGCKRALRGRGRLEDGAGRGGLTPRPGLSAAPTRQRPGLRCACWAARWAGSGPVGLAAELGSRSRHVPAT